YKHMDVEQFVGSAFVSYAVSTKPIPDGGYGFSGIAAEGAFGALARVATAPASAPVGGPVGRFEGHYLTGPRLGRVGVRVDGQSRATVDTEAARLGVDHSTIEVPDGPHRLEVAGVSGRRVRLLGAVLERAAPGIVVDSLGVGAMNTRCLVREAAAINVP